MNNKDLISLMEKATLTLGSQFKPTVVFDLDDTLFDSRSRTLKILKEFAISNLADKETQNKLNRAVVADVRYLLKDTLELLDIKNKNEIKTLQNFWAKRFFSGEYAEKDDVISYAVSFARHLASKNINLIYLTGRSEKMRAGTKASLISKGFNLCSDSHLLMKEDPKQPDLIYKQAVASLLKEREDIKVIAFFENQPENANQFIEFFPNALHFLIDTIHAPTTVVLDKRIKLIKKFIEVAD